MKNKILYIILGVVVAAVIVLFFTNSSGDKKKVLDERFSFRKRDKIPYSASVAFGALKEMFPRAVVTAERQEPGMWDTLSSYKGSQALIILTPFFQADEYELNELLSFIKEGNQIFISTIGLSEPVQKKLGCYPAYTAALDLWGFGMDTLSVSLVPPLTRKKTTYTYPGKQLDTWLNKWDSLTTEVLGYSSSDKPNFVRMAAGKGHLFLHFAPMTLTNYFLLHRDNLTFYEQLMSVLPADTEVIVWDEYFINRRNRSEGENKGKSWFWEFMKHKPLRWALLTAMAALLVYVLMEMRRKQRPIPVVKSPKNDSLDFVKTIGRLYYDKGDHKNLARKMSAYFLEHVRNRYKLNTAELDEDFIRSLQYKSGVSEEEVRAVVQAIKRAEEQPLVSDRMLADLHRQLESFYKKA